MSASGSPEFSDVQSHRWSRVVSSDRSTGKSGGANGNANSSFPGRSQNVAHQLIHVQNRSNSSAIGGSGIGIGATNTNFPLVASSKGSNVASFGTPSISNRSPSSKLLWSECAPRLTSEDNIIEESTIPSAIDVLSSPRQRSLNSSLTGRTGATRGAIGPALPLHGGPTASDVSVLMRRTQHGFGERDQKGAVAEEGSLGPSELQRPMIGATESTAGIERDQTRDVSEDNGERINVSSIVKARLPGKFVGKAQEALRCKNGMIRQHYVGRIGEGQGARQQLWGGYGVSSDRNMWKKGGERDRDENWNHERNSAVCKVEGHLVPKEAKSKERLWGGHVSGREDIGLKASGTEKLGKTQLWKGEDKEHEREEQGAWKRTGEQHTGNKWRREGVEGGARKGGDEGENVQCPHCERRLRNAVTLQNHVRVVHDHSGNFLCSQCPAAFMWRSTLGNHVRLVHEKQRPYDCKECHKAFRWRSHLREHIWVVHKNEKPFRCETCGKTFGRKNNMQKHMRKHLQQNGQQ